MRHRCWHCRSIEKKRCNSARTRNTRLAAINSFFRSLEYRSSCLDQSRRIHAILVEKTDRLLIGYLRREEQALLNASDASTMSGIRDRATLHLAFATGFARAGVRSVSGSIRSTVRLCPAYTSWEKDVASESCHSGKKRRPR